MNALELDRELSKMKVKAFEFARLFTSGQLDPKTAGYKSSEEAVFLIIKECAEACSRMVLAWERANPLS